MGKQCDTFLRDLEKKILEGASKRFRYLMATSDGKHTDEDYVFANTRSEALEEVGKIARHKGMKVVSIDER